MSEFNLILLSYVKFRVGQCGKLLQNEPSYLSAVRIHTPMAFFFYHFDDICFFIIVRNHFTPLGTGINLPQSMCRWLFVSFTNEKVFQSENNTWCKWMLAISKTPMPSLYKYITAIQVTIYITLMPLILCPVHLYAYKSWLNLVNR